MSRRRCPRVHFPQDAAIQIKLLLLTNGRLVPCLLFCFLLLPFTLFEFQCFNSLQLQKLKPAAFAILASSNGSKKFLISSRAGARRKTEPQGHEQRELVHPFLAAASHYISSTACWARTINTGCEAASSVVLTLPLRSFDVSIHRTNKILLSKIQVGFICETLPSNSVIFFLVGK